MPKTTENDGFLFRWSQRKQAAATDAPAEPEAAPPPPQGHNSGAAPAEPPDSELSDAELLERYTLPDPEAMESGDDFAAFMKTGVPDRLRRRALRRLWLTDPVFANLDELVDYGEDFTDAATVIENMQTVYEVGKGAAARVRAELDALAAAAQDEPVEATPEHEADPDPAQTNPISSEASESAPPLPSEEPRAVSEVAVPDPAMRKARPMRFEFD